MPDVLQGTRVYRALLTACGALLVTALFTLGFAGNAPHPDAAQVASHGQRGGPTTLVLPTPSTTSGSRVLGRAKPRATSTTQGTTVSSEPGSLESTTTTTPTEPTQDTPSHQVDVQVPGTAVHVTLGSGPGSCNDLGITLLKPDQCQGGRHKA